MVLPPIPHSVISVSAEDDVVVLRPRGELDRSTTETLVGLVAAATGCGAVAAVVFVPDASGALTPIAPADEPAAIPDLTDTADTTDTVDVVGPGRVRLRAANRSWTVDLVGARMFACDGPVDWRFVGAAAWTPIVGLWASRTRVAVRTHGGVVSIATGWRSTLGQAPAPPTPARWRHPAA